MISISVYTARTDGTARLIAETLARFGGVLALLPPAMEQIGRGEPRFLVQAVNRLERMCVPGAVLVLADQNAPRRLELSEDTVVVAGTDNRRMRRLMKGRPNTIVACGTGSRDTLTVSSLMPERAVLCLQREIPLAGGGTLEPCELCIEPGGAELRSLLLAAGTAAVCGCDLSGADYNALEKTISSGCS